MIGRWILLGLAAIAVILILAYLKRLAAFWERVREFYHEVVLEMRKVVWPTQEHIINSTVIVGVATIAMVLVIGVVDRFFGTIVQFIFSTQ